MEVQLAMRNLANQPANMYALTDYDYPLPEELIAQEPVSCRDQSRLMVLTREGRSLEHSVFSHLERLLQPGDLLVVNDTKVIPGRLLGRKETGGKIELLLLDYPGKEIIGDQGPGCEQRPRQVRFQCLARSSKIPRPGTRIFFSQDLQATVMGGAKGQYFVVFTHGGGGNFDEALEAVGQIPLPPYIRRPAIKGPDTQHAGGKPADCDDRTAYQTVYAREKGAVAAPTAGLHFSEGLLAALQRKGVEIASLTLHVGHGTFLPVRVRDIREHQIHSERYSLGADTASAVNRAKNQGRRVIAVGTTAVRVLEYRADGHGCVQPGSGDCDAFIYPGFRFQIIDGLITNFHLPQSTLLMLVSAFAGRDFILQAYQEAIGRRYRFYSYGDAMLIV